MPKSHQNDILLVRNIDVNCDDVTTDVIPGYHKETDEDTGETFTRYDNIPYEFNHKDKFAVRWAMREHAIKPGETRMFPRFLAEHYAKHLADHVLQKRERDEKRMGLVNNAVERPKVLDQIIVKTVQYFEGDQETDEGLEALKQVEEINLNLGTGNFAEGEGKGRELRELDAGNVPNKAVGELSDKPALTEAEAIERINDPTIGNDPGNVVNEPMKPLPPKADLIREAVKLGIDLKSRDTAEDIAAKIRAF